VTIVSNTEQYLEIQTFHRHCWLVAETGIDRRFLGAMIDETMQTEPDAMRVIRRVIRPKQMYQGDYVTHVWRTLGSDNIPDDMPALTKKESVKWQSIADMENPFCFYLFRYHFSVFLRSRFVTVYDILFNPRIVEELQKNWQVLQAGLQPIAVFQAAILMTDAPTMVRDLSKFIDALHNQLLQSVRTNPIPVIAPGGLSAVIAEIQQKSPPEDHHRLVMTRLVASLPMARDWVTRFCELMNLLSSKPSMAEQHYVDLYLSELLQTEGVVVDSSGSQREITDLLGQIRDWVNGQKLESKPEHAKAWRRYNDMARSGDLPWTRDALRRLLLRELRRPDVNQSPPDLIQAIVDVDALGADIDTTLSCWRGDAEVLDCLDQRIRAYLRRDLVQRLMVRHRQPTERISAIASMFSILRSLPNRDRFAEFVEEFLVVPTLVKEMEAELSGRLAVVPPLLRFVQRLSAVDIDAERRQRMIAAFDEALADILRQEIVNVPGRRDIDKTLALLRLWLPAPLSEGRCRELVEGALESVIQQPSFFNDFLASYKHDKVRSKAAESLDRLLVEYGFKAASEI